jgi:hypothetical protein
MTTNAKDPSLSDSDITATAMRVIAQMREIWTKQLAEGMPLSPIVVDDLFDFRIKYRVYGLLRARRELLALPGVY